MELGARSASDRSESREKASASDPDLLEAKTRPARFAVKIPNTIEACSSRDVAALRELAESPGGLVTNECRREACG